MVRGKKGRTEVNYKEFKAYINMKTTLFSTTSILSWLLALNALTGIAGTFKDNFNDGDDKGWKRFGQGTWKVVNGEYKMTSKVSVSGSSWGDVKWKNYTVEATVRVIKANYIGVCVRQLDQLVWLGN